MTEYKTNALIKFVSFFTKRCRAGVARQHIIDQEEYALLDIGCGDYYFINTLKNIQAWGIDRIHGQEANDFLSRKYTKFDYVTLLATLEHFENYKQTLDLIWTNLDTNGRVIITTPTEKAKPFLEWLARGSKSHDAYHKQYLSEKDFLDLNNFELILYEKFMLGMNQIIVLLKREEGE